jgi:hypothetical protein
MARRPTWRDAHYDETPRLGVSLPGRLTRGDAQIGRLYYIPTIKWMLYPITQQDTIDYFANNLTSIRNV